MTATKNLIRHLVPRPIRNAIRRPKVLVTRIAAKLSAMCGRFDMVKMTTDWELKCHPLCKPDFAVFQTDPEQRDELTRFIEQIKPGLHFLDVGAHWGVFSLAALRYGGESAKCLCIEASNAAAATLKANFALNDKLGQVTIVNAACGEHVGTLQMLTTGAGGSDYFVVPSEPRPDTIQVPQVTVDSVCESESFSPTHIKIDVEGYEEEVLRGAQRTIQRHEPALFIELHGHHIHARIKEPETVLALLTQLGYTQWTSVDGKLLGQPELIAANYCVRFFATKAQ
ncbi:MAG: FkbM family methyltransferase [Verrucomicrobiales bacterium]|nr:FkbM family methyltransferase [Verrucomicrobiales bacterium]